MSRQPKFGLSLQNKISRKLSLCQKLQAFFDECKSLVKLSSLEILSTSLMISAKVFENEEEVKTFKKHAKYCGKSIDHLKGVELDLLGKFNWNVPHSSMTDFALFYFSNLLFRDSDIIRLEKGCGFDYNWQDFHSFFAMGLGLASPDFKALRAMLGGGKKKKFLEPVVLVRHLKKENLNSVAAEILLNYKTIIKIIHHKFAFKSNLRNAMGAFILIWLKEYQVGKTFSTYLLVKDFLCFPIRR